MDRQRLLTMPKAADTALVTTDSNAGSHGGDHGAAIHVVLEVDGRVELQ
jgi:hypothetical protein